MATSREPYRNVAYMAAWLGVEPATVRQWARDGVIRGHQPGGRIWLFLESEVAADIAASGKPAETVSASPSPRERRPRVVSTAPITSIRDRIRQGTLGSAR